MRIVYGVLFILSVLMAYNIGGLLWLGRTPYAVPGFGFWKFWFHWPVCLVRGCVKVRHSAKSEACTRCGAAWWND